MGLIPNYNMKNRSKMVTKIIDNILDHDWDEFIISSPHGSVFSKSTFLKALDVPHHKLFLELDGKTVASALIIKPDSPIFRAPFSYSMYQGISLAPLNGDIYKTVPLSLKIIEAFNSALSEKYTYLSFCQHHSFKDLRGFQWFNYHTPDLGQYDIKLHYTGIIKLNQYSSFEAYLNSIRNVRRQEYNKARRLNLFAAESDDPAEFALLYKQTFQRQNIVVESDVIARAIRIVESGISEGFGRLVYCRDQDGMAHSVIFTLHDAKCMYYMFGATNPKYRSSGASTSLVLNSIKHAYACKHNNFDMVGMNSPQRGSFKTSFNAEPAPYFTLSRT